MTESVRVLIPEEEVNKRIKEMAEKISADIGDETITLICILKGSVFFSCELAKNIKGSVMLDFMSVTSYGDDTKSSGVVKIIKDLDDPLEGKNVLVVEDIIDSGRTLSYLLKNLKARNPKSLRLCTLLDKPDRDIEICLILECWNLMSKRRFLIEEKL